MITEMKRNIVLPCQYFRYIMDEGSHQGIIEKVKFNRILELRKINIAW
jgi:hypothetical protein